MTKMRLRRRRQPADVDAHVSARNGSNSSTLRVRVCKFHEVGQITQLQASSSDRLALFELGQPLLEFGELPLQPDDRIGRRVGHFDLRTFGDDANRLTVLRDDSRRNADDGRVCRHVLNDDRTPADLRVITQHDCTEHAGVDADVTLRPSVGWRFPCERLVPPSVTP